MSQSHQLSDIRIRDPFILQAHAGYVLYGTTDENVWGGPAAGFDCYTSDDLQSWNGPIEAFRPSADFWSNSQFWAPEVHEYRGRYYLFATFMATHSQVRGIAVLVSDSAIGPYVPWSDGPITPPGVPSLDGTLFIDEDSQPWLVYSRGAEGTAAGEPAISDGEMYALRLSDDLREPVGVPELLFRASAATWSKPLRFPDGAAPPPELRLAPDPLFTDGPFLRRTPDGTLLMLWSSFGDEGYAMGIARSETGTVLGPWTQLPEPLWARNGGHGMILSGPGGQDYLVFHAPNDTPHERAALIPIEYDDDGIRLVE